MSFHHVHSIHIEQTIHGGKGLHKDVNTKNEGLEAILEPGYHTILNQ